MLLPKPDSPNSGIASPIFRWAVDEEGEKLVSDRWGCTPWQETGLREVHGWLIAPQPVTVGSSLAQAPLLQSLALHFRPVLRSGLTSKANHTALEAAVGELDCITWVGKKRPHTYETLARSETFVLYSVGWAAPGGAVQIDCITP